MVEYIQLCDQYKSYNIRQFIDILYVDDIRYSGPS